MNQLLRLPLTQGFTAIIDDDERGREASMWKWYARRNGQRIYAARGIWGAGPNGQVKIEYLHNFILGVKGVDHINGDGLDNRLANLRPATHQQNLRGFQRKRQCSTSKFRGVYWAKLNQKWAAQIKIHCRATYLGLFDSEEDAARAYDAAARNYFGEFAHLNLKCQ